MSSTSQPPAASAPSTSAPDATDLQTFLASAHSRNINLGVVLEILQLANNNVARATRILDIVAEDPPAQPSQIASSKSEASTSAVTDAEAAASSAASNGNAVAVAVVPLSAGVAAVGTGGVSTSTATPFSQVGDLPTGATVNIDSNISSARVTARTPAGADTAAPATTASAVRGNSVASKTTGGGANAAVNRTSTTTHPMPLQQSIDTGREIAERVMGARRDN